MLRGEINRKNNFPSLQYIGTIDSLPLTYPASINLFKANIETPNQCVKSCQIQEKRYQSDADDVMMMSIILFRCFHYRL